MKQLFSLLCCAVISLSATAAEPDKSSADKDAIRKVLDSQAEAWNKGDLKAFMVGYWQADKLSFFSGNTKTLGWKATMERYQKRYQAEGKEMGKLSFSELEIELAGPESAWVRGRWKLMQTNETHNGLFTLIMKKLPDGWRIVHDHTSGE